MTGKPQPQLTLLLLRHAKSSWSEPGIDDRERPLNKRGQAAAPLVAAFMRAQGLMPDLILCSSAVRARATLALVAETAGLDAPVTFADDLYLAEPEDLLARLRRIKGRIATVLLVGHSPGLHELALDLAATGDEKALGRLGAKFPTAALAVIDFPARRWSELGRVPGRLRLLVTPKSLAGSDAAA